MAISLASVLASSPYVASAAADCSTGFRSSDFVYGGVAGNNNGTIPLTPAIGGKFGATWNKTRVDLSQDFCVSAEVYLGNYDPGADGLAFVMQPNSVAAGSVGGGLGYMGISPSFAVEYDTYQNGDAGDPAQDHVGLMKNGSTNHYGSQFGVSPVSVGNIEDGNWRKTKIYWNSSASTITVSLDQNLDGDTDDSGETLFDGVSADLQSIFTASSGEAYWGFTAATGGMNNNQSVRNIAYGSTPRQNLPPSFSSPPGALTISASTIGTAVNFNLADDSSTQSQWTISASSSDEAIVPNTSQYISAVMSSATAGYVTVNPLLTAAGNTTITVTAVDADGASIQSQFVVTVTAVDSSLHVTSLDDTTSQGTLRWAIAQANGTAGGVYDAITIDVPGTITLTSDLPALTQGLTIIGTGLENTIIDGNNLYRAFYNNGSRVLRISDMTLKQGKPANGGMIWNQNGTLYINRVKFTAMTSGSAAYQNNGGAMYFNDSRFTNLSYGTASDYGSTPSAVSNVDADYANRMYFENVTFSNNYAGIYNYRFTKINNSTFNNNTYGANITGLNRSQIYNSTFNSNGIGIYHNAWTPTSWTSIGSNNRIIDNNVFNNNGQAIYLDDGWNNGRKTQVWSTVTNNFWDETGTFVTAYTWNGTANVASYGVPADTATEWYQNSNAVPTTTTTTTTTSTTVPETEAPSVSVPDTTIVEEPLTPVITIPDVPTGTIPSEPSTDTTLPALDPEPTPEVTIETSPSTSDPEDNEPASSVPQYAPEDETPTETIPEVDTPVDTQDAADAAVDNILAAADNADELGAAVTDAISNADSPEEVAALVTSLLDAPLSDEEFGAVVASVFTDDLSIEELSAALDAVFAEPLSDEKFAEVIDAVLDEPLTDEQFTAVLDILESDTVSEDQVSAAVDKILENEVTADQATELATSEKVLESIDSDQAAEIFDAIPVGELTSEEEAALVAAVTNAPEEVKNAFESTIDIFGEGLDDYVAVGSQVDVGTRRSLIAASAVVSALTTVGAAGAGSGGPSGPSSNGGGNGGGGNGNGTTEGRSKKEEEGEQEAAGEIAGPEEDEDKKPFTRNSIFKYMEN